MLSAYLRGVLFIIKFSVVFFSIFGDLQQKSVEQTYLVVSLYLWYLYNAIKSSTYFARLQLLLMERRKDIEQTIIYLSHHYYFYMNNHLQYSTYQSLEVIAKFIKAYWTSYIPVQGYCYVLVENSGITKSIYALLDAKSKSNVYENYLIFQLIDDWNTTITYFGPFGGQSYKRVQIKLRIAEGKIQKQKKEFEDKLKKLKKQAQPKFKVNLLDTKQWPALDSIIKKRDDKQKELSSLEIQQKKLNLTLDNAATSFNATLKAYNLIAEQVIKIGAKQSAKIEGKKIPIVGLIAGLAFRILRAVQGDWTGAVGQVVSGAASIVPRKGTALYAMIDSGLLTKDIVDNSNKAEINLRKSHKEKITAEGVLKQKQNQILKLQKEVNQLDILIYKNDKYFEDYKNIIVQLQNIQKQMSNKIKNEDKQFLRFFSQLPIVHFDHFTNETDLYIVENIKQFKNHVGNQEKKSTTEQAGKNQAIAIILAIIIPTNYEMRADLANLLQKASLTKPQIKLILDALPKIKDNTLKADSQVSFSNQRFIFQEKQNGLKAISLRYGMKAYLSANLGKICVNRPFCNSWQKFYVEQLSNRKCAIKTPTGQYLGTDKDGAVQAIYKEINEHSTFDLMKFKDGSVALRDSHLRYLSVPFIISSDAIWQK